MQKNQVLWISHRGYHAQAVENTMAAFDAAIAAGFTHIETDLRCSADGHIVLHHDPNLENTCASPRLISQSMWKDLRNLKTRDDQFLLDFETFIERYAGFSWTFDIKPETAKPVLLALLKWAKANKAEPWLKEQARFLCWSRKTERTLRQLFPGSRTLAREEECYRAGLAVYAKLPCLGGIRQGRIYALPRFFGGRDLYTPRVIEAYHERGARVLAYLPDSIGDAKAALLAGFDEILTNHLPISE